MHNPQCHRLGRPSWQDYEAHEKGFQFIQQRPAIDWFRPRLDWRLAQLRLRTHFVIVIRTFHFHFITR